MQKFSFDDQYKLLYYLLDLRVRQLAGIDDIQIVLDVFRRADVDFHACAALFDVDKIFIHGIHFSFGFGFGLYFESLL